MNNPDNRILDMKMWNKHIGQTCYELHPSDKNQYRTYYRWNAFAGAMRAFLQTILLDTTRRNATNTPCFYLNQTQCPNKHHLINEMESIINLI